MAGLVVIRHVMHELYLIGAKSGVQSFEFVRGVHLETQHFSVENGLLTGTVASLPPARQTLLTLRCACIARGTSGRQARRS
jgi:hypothetical protein